MTSNETMKVLTIYEQNEYIFSDKIRRITPNKIRPIDRNNYKRKRTVFTGDTKFRVVRIEHTLGQPYEWSAKEIKPKIEFKPKFENDIKPLIKWEPKDIKPFIKIESKPEFKREIKDENNEEIIKDKEKSKDVTSDELPDSEALKRKTGFEELVSNKRNCFDIETDVESNSNDFDESSILGFEDIDETTLDSDPISYSSVFENKDETTLDSDEITPNMSQDMDETTLDSYESSVSSQELQDIVETALDSDEFTPNMSEDMDESTLDSYESSVSSQELQDIVEMTLDSDAISYSSVSEDNDFEDIDETTLDSDALSYSSVSENNDFDFDMDETTLDSYESSVTPQELQDRAETTLASDDTPVVAQESNQTARNVEDHNYCTAISTPNDVPLRTDNSLELSTSSTSSNTTIICEYTPPVVKDSFERLEPQLRTKVYKLILSFLSLEDKLKLQLVCKEWQKIIVCQQKTLKLHYSRQKKGIRCPFKINFCGDVITFANSRDFNEVSQKLITKFPELTDIEVLSLTNININPIVNKINESLVGLTSVKLKGQISTDVLTRFGLCFGAQLKSIDINSGSYYLTDEELIESKLLSNNLESIHVSHSMERLNLTFLPQLRQLLDVSHTDIDGLRVVADLYAKQITKISFFELLDCGRYPKVMKRIVETLEQLSRFERLEYLDFYFSKNSLNSEFRPIEQKCKHLKELHIFGSISHFSLHRLSAFKELKVLGLFIDCIPDTRLDFSGLTSLDLTELWMYCDIYLSELQIILKSMENLKTLHIKSNECYESQIIELINCDSNLKSIYLEDSLITRKTVTAIVEKAKCSPKVQYSLISDIFADKSTKHLCKQLIRDDLPKNLTIIMERNKADPLPRPKRGRPKKLAEKQTEDQTEVQTEAHTEWQPIYTLPTRQQTDSRRLIQLKRRHQNCEWLKDHNYSTNLCWRYLSSDILLSKPPTVPLFRPN